MPLLTKSDCSWSKANNRTFSPPLVFILLNNRRASFPWLSDIIPSPFLGAWAAGLKVPLRLRCILHVVPLHQPTGLPVPPALKSQTVLKPHLIWLSASFVPLRLFCHCPKANRSLGQWPRLVFGTISFTEHLYVHLWCHITNNKNRTASGLVFLLSAPRQLWGMGRRRTERAGRFRTRK